MDSTFRDEQDTGVEEDAAGAVEAGPLSTRYHKEYNAAIKFIFSKILNGMITNVK